ncbi:plasmid replication protein RepC [Mangrovicoccus sp. HB161399]|uniref:plasmid replication protein RepC n=1 Tax=Mangrovicoccus sp. HB161399 TaxID=2720392 RepID=UPI0015575958|nr:plasmid replication protein RepC [Mangrovicoccus sp. HB161399]
MKSISSQVPPVRRPANEGVLSADNRFVLMPALRKARVALGLTPQVLATLEAMLTCLPKNGQSRVVFASNATLTHRRNGISDRTIRRHIARLAELGLLKRCDSPNAKRYSRRNPLTGDVLQFGLDLAPLFDQGAQIMRLAEVETAREESCAFLRLRIRASLHNQTEDRRSELLALLRRRLTLETLQEISASLAAGNIGENDEDRPAPAGSQPNPSVSPETKMSATDSHSVRHHQRSDKDTQYRDSSEQSTRTLTLGQVKSACQFAMSFSPEPVQSWEDLIRHSNEMASLMGIAGNLLHSARESRGPVATAKTILLMTEMRDRLRAAPAYFRAVTTGERAQRFDPDVLLSKRFASSMMSV